MILYSIRSERQLMEQLNYNLLFRWFVGLEMDDPVWDVTVFTKNRERLIGGAVSQQLLGGGAGRRRDEHDLLSEEHFTVDGTLIQAWASARSFKDKSDPPAPGAGSGWGGEVLLRDKVESKTDPDARLYKKATADKSVPAYQGHALTENRNGSGSSCKPHWLRPMRRLGPGFAMLDRTLSSEGRPESRAADHAGCRYGLSAGEIRRSTAQTQGSAARQRVS